MGAGVMWERLQPRKARYKAASCKFVTLALCIFAAEAAPTGSVANPRAR